MGTPIDDRMPDTAALPIAPLTQARWDGRLLRLWFAAQSDAQTLELKLDGVSFARRALSTKASVEDFAFPFSPSGRAVQDLDLSLLRDNRPLLKGRWQIRHRTGVADDSAAIQDLAPLTAATAMPMAVDLAPASATIIVPIFNAPAAVERCIESVLAHTSGPARLILLDDASGDPAIAPLLARYAGLSKVSVLRNECNLGFTGSVNRCLQMAESDDVVLLNADTEVGPNWLTGLRRAAYADADTATATAVSDNAGAFSVPELEHENSFPPQWSFVQTSRACWQYAGLAYPRLPTGNGFCMYIRAAVLARIGLLDAEAFPQGYGEENDFCQRAEQLGYRHVVAGNVLVRHARSLSFGHERRAALGVSGMQVLRTRYPHYEAAVGATLFSYERRVLEWRIRSIYASAGKCPAPAPRVLSLGDTTSLSLGFEHWRVLFEGGLLRLQRHDNQWCHVDECIGAWCDPVAPATWHHYESALHRWLQYYAIELVETVLLGGHSPRVAQLAAALVIPVCDGTDGDSDVRRRSALASARSFVFADAPR
jgi:GT2 family glycosyltransferase